MKRFLAVLGASLIGVAGMAAPAGAATGVTTLVSQADGAPLHKSHSPVMSDDANLVAFVGNSDGLRNLLLVDRTAGTTTTVAGDTAESPRMSGDGTTVLYQRFGNLFAYDVATAGTSLLASGAQAGGISNDGRFVSYSRRAGVFLLDRVGGTTTALPGVDVNLQPDHYGAGPVSDDGSVVAFGADTVGNFPYRNRQAFVWRQSTGAVEMVSVDEGGTKGNGSSAAFDITPDGRHLAMESMARLTSADPNFSRQDVYVRDLVTGTTAFVGANFPDDDYPNSGYNREPRISDDGNLVAFVTDARIAGKWDNETDIVLADRAAGTLEIVSKALDGSPAGSSGAAQLSGDGRHVGFASSAIDIVTPFDTLECVEREYDEGMWTVNYGECSNVYVIDRAATAVSSSGGTVTEGSTSVFVPAGFPGTVSIAPAASGTSVPSGYQVLGQQLQIEAPTATYSSPLRLTFTVDGSHGVAAADIAVIRDGVPIVDCPGATTALPPDASSADGYPCVTSRTTLADGDVVLVVLTPHASVWTTAKVPPPVTPNVTFASLCESTQAAVGQKGMAQSLCAKLAAASSARDRGDGPASAKQLDAYRNEVKAQTGKSLTVAQADDLTAKSRLV